MKLKRKELEEQLTREIKTWSVARVAWLTRCDIENTRFYNLVILLERIKELELEYEDTVKVYENLDASLPDGFLDFKTGLKNVKRWCWMKLNRLPVWWNWDYIKDTEDE